MLNAGTITVNPTTGDVTGTGLALALIQAHVATMVAGPFWATMSGPDRASFLSTHVPLYTGLAQAIVDHFVANAEITIKIAPGDVGLQKTPSPNDPDQPTQGPSATKTLVTKGTIA